jgi:hypothetical protein
MDLPFSITRETLILALLYIIGTAIALTKIIDGLQKAGVIKDETTGHWNQALSLVGAIAIVVLQQLGAGAGVEDAQQAGALAAATLIAAGLIAFLTWAFHQGVLILEGLKPKPTTPTATVTVKTSGDASASAVASSSPSAPDTIAPLPTSSTEVYSESPLSLGQPQG